MISYLGRDQDPRAQARALAGLRDVDPPARARDPALLRDQPQDPPHGHRARPDQGRLQAELHQLPEHRLPHPPRLHHHHQVQQQDLQDRRHQLDCQTHGHFPGTIEFL